MFRRVAAVVAMATLFVFGNLSPTPLAPSTVTTPAAVTALDDPAPRLGADRK